MGTGEEGSSRMRSGWSSLGRSLGIEIITVISGVSEGEGGFCIMRSGGVPHIQ